MYKIVLIISMAILTFSAMAVADSPQAYVLNSTAETISRIDLSTNVVYNDVETVGSDVLSYPNQMIIRDTLMYLVISGTNEIQVVNLKDETTIGFINTGSSTNPYWADFINDQYLYVSLLLTDKLAKIDLSTGLKVNETTIGKAPEGVLIVGDKLYVACSGFDFSTYLYDPGKVAIYDLTGDSVVGEIAVGLNPQYMEFDSLGRVHVVCTGNYSDIAGAVYIVDPEVDVVVDSVLVGGNPGQIAIGPDNIAYVAGAGWSEHGYVYSYNALTGEIFHGSADPITVDLNCIAVSTYQDGNLYAGSFGTHKVNEIDSAGGVVNSYAVNSGPTHILFNYLPGDANGDYSVNLLDITYLINWLYLGSTSPVWPKWRANANADGGYNILDVTYLINYLYNSGNRPITGPRWLR